MNDTDARYAPTIKVDNFDAIAEFLRWGIAGAFYAVQILKRKKDHPGSCWDKDPNHNGKHHAHSRVLASYQVYSLADLSDLRDRIVETCDSQQARAYISVNRTTVELVAMALAKSCIDARLQTRVKFTQLLDSAIGTTCAESSRLWIVDVDDRDAARLGMSADAVCSYINDSRSVGKPWPPVVLPTPNGKHVITRGFDSRALPPEFKIHRNNPTVLYANVAAGANSSINVNVNVNVNKEALCQRGEQ